MIDLVPLCMELNGVIDQGENLRKYKQINQFASHFYAWAWYSSAYRKRNW